jgi:hypothetical protein
MRKSDVKAVRVRYRILPSGRIAGRPGDVRVDGYTRHSRLTRCFDRRLTGMRFPSFDGPPIERDFELSLD